ncbi:MAG: AraC family transcriptional regulator [Hungatella sp.]|jgi:AraC-like DNA-binding protein|nr:AraC family transcriptional regulator [Hungatella sp.]
METALSVNIPVYEHQQLSINAFGHSVTMPGHTYGPAVRPYYLIHFILEGKGEFIVNGTHYKLSAGKGFLIEPDYQTVYKADLEDPWTYIWIGFSGKDAWQAMAMLGLSQEQPIFKSEEKETLKTCVMSMIRRNRRNAADTFYSLSMLFLFLSTIAASSQDDSLKGGNLYVDQAMAYIRSHIAEPLKTEDIARYVGLNRSYLSALFKEQTGLSPLKYIQRSRLTKAQHLLESSRLSVASIAYACGYQQPESLMKIFRQQYGMSPSAYRKMIRQQSAVGSV